MPKQTKIVIAGAGFAGLAAALNLEKRFKNNKAVSITLVDRHDYHLFAPNLHEVATAEEEMASISQLKKSIAIPIKEILDGKNIVFIKGELTAVDNCQKRIRLGTKILEYDYLVLALGTVPDFLGISGAKNYGMPLCGLAGALRIRNAVEFAVQAHKMSHVKEVVNLVIAGGGPSSVEFAGELAGLADRVAWKYGYPREKINITIVESSSRLLSGFGEQAGKDAFLRLKELGVRVELEKSICQVDRNLVEFATAERMHYDVLVWNAGEKGAEIKFEKEIAKNRKGQLEVGQNLALAGDSHIFALGDLAAVTGPAGQEIFGGGVEWALAQAKYFAHVLPKLMRNQRPKPFAFKSSGCIIMIGGKWAIASLKKKYFMGFCAFLLGQWVRLNYYRKITGWGKAIKYWWLDRQLYGRND